MDLVSRLMALIFLLLPAFAFSASCPTSYYAVSQQGSSKAWSGPVGSNNLDALNAACAGLDARYQAAGNTVVVNGALTSTCGYWSGGVWTGVPGTSAAVYLSKYFKSPTGAWVPNDPGTCVVPTCPSGQTLDTETNTCECDSIYNAGVFVAPGDVIEACNGGCKLLLSAGYYDKPGNYTAGKWIQTAASCTPSDVQVDGQNTPRTNDAKRCPAGQCPGTVNGAQVCVACTAPRQTGNTNINTGEKTTSPNGTQSPTSSSSSSSSSTTKCDGPNCTTTTTTTMTTADGGKIEKTSTKNEPKADFCKENPKADMCKEGGSWGGSCGAFTCDGDPVSCAIAQASWKSACSLDLEPSDSKVQAGNAAMAGGDRPPGHPGSNPQSSVFSANIDQTNPLSAQCPADIPIDVMGQSFSIPLSHACDGLRAMGQIAVAFSLVAAAFIVFGGTKG